VSPEASGDKNESKIVEVDYEIPPNVGMTNCSQKKILLILLILSIRVQKNLYDLYV
jgi:hypothetical protein